MLSQDLCSALRFAPPFPGRKPDGSMPMTSADVLNALGRVPPMPDTPPAVTRLKRWVHDGVVIQLLSYSTGYGPATEALLLTPNIDTTTATSSDHVSDGQRRRRRIAEREEEDPLGAAAAAGGGGGGDDGDDDENDLSPLGAMRLSHTVDPDDEDAQCSRTAPGGGGGGGAGRRSRPGGVTQRNSNKGFPAVLYLHSHDDVKSYGKEKVVETGNHEMDQQQLPESVSWVRRDHYGGRAPANQLAKLGFAVLVHDNFLWGSRKVEPTPQRLKEILRREDDVESQQVMIESMCVSKYLSLYGATLAGMLNFDDRVALQVLESLPERDKTIKPAVVGLSGGGCRAVWLHATCAASHSLNAVVVVGAMATYTSMLREHITPHSWMFFPHGFAALADWPAVACVNAASTPLFVQYCANDQLFTVEGMEEAHNKIQEYYGSLSPPSSSSSSSPSTTTSPRYLGKFYPVRHQFSVEMQDDAFEWLIDINVDTASTRKANV